MDKKRGKGWRQGWTSAARMAGRMTGKAALWRSSGGKGGGGALARGGN